MDVYSSRLRFFTDLSGKLISENINLRRFMDNSWSLVQIQPPQPKRKPLEFGKIPIFRRFSYILSAVKTPYLHSEMQ